MDKCLHGDLQPKDLQTDKDLENLLGLDNLLK